MIGIAVLGAGIFAREEYLPALKLSKRFSLKAVYSRSKASSEAFSALAPSPIDTYYETPQESNKSLKELLARSDIGAVVVCLPIPAQPDVIRQAIAAGKAVLSEKPIAKDSETAKSLIQWHGSLERPPVWSVAENFRLIPSLEVAAKKIKEIGGDLVTFRLRISMLMDLGNKYALTEWRQVPQYQGGYLLDGGIHGLAGLRMFVAATGQELTKVACFSRLIHASLAPIDSVYAIGQTTSGCGGNITLSWGTEYDSAWEIEVTTTNGVVNWKDGAVKTIQKSGTEIQEATQNSGVASEVEAFAQSVEANQGDPRQTPTEALQDLELLEALLRSGEAEGSVKIIPGSAQ